MIHHTSKAAPGTLCTWRNGDCKGNASHDGPAPATMVMGESIGAWRLEKGQAVCTYHCPFDAPAINQVLSDPFISEEELDQLLTDRRMPGRSAEPRPTEDILLPADHFATPLADWEKELLNSTQSMFDYLNQPFKAPKSVDDSLAQLQGPAGDLTAWRESGL